MSAPAAPLPIADLGPVQRLPLDTLTPYPANARRITAKAVDLTAESLRLFGWQQPLVVDPGRVLIVGHVRHRAARQLGAVDGPVIIAEHLTAAEVKAYRIADNRTHDYTAWDYGTLARELDGLPDDFARVLDLADWEAIVAGFEDARADGLLPNTTERTSALLGGGFALSVVFADREAADKAAPAIMDIPGVLNVRHGFTANARG